MRLRGVIALTLLTGCGTANTLDGSISEVLSLEFVHTELKKQDDALLVDYINIVDEASEITLRLVVETEGVEGANSALKGDVFLSQVVLRRATKENEVWPTVEQGSLTFDTFDFTSGGHVAGRFYIAFTEGRLLDGSFDGTVVEE